MFSTQSAFMNYNGPCRALDTIRGDTVNNRFIIGSCIINHTQSTTSRIGNNASNNPTINRSLSNNNDTMMKNRLSIIEYKNDTNELYIQNEYDHFTGSVYNICTHPTDQSLVITSSEQATGATLWKLPTNDSTNNTYDEQRQQQDNDYDDSSSNYYYNSTNSSRQSSTIVDSYSNQQGTVQEMERIATLVHPDDEDDDVTLPYSMKTTTTSIAWRDSRDDTTTSSTNGDVVMIDFHGRVTQWDISFGTADPTQRTTINKQNSNTTTTTTPPKIVWDPHSNGDIVAACFNNTIHVLDWRMDTTIPSGIVDTISNCHKYGGITDLQYNPNKPYVIVTGGKDTLLKFWDIRSTKTQPLLTARGGHNHYITNIKYNPYHDQLVLSTGSDNIVNLWRFSTISSAPLLAYDNSENINMINTTANSMNNTNNTYYDGTGSTSQFHNSTVSSSSTKPTVTNTNDTSTPNACVTQYEHGSTNSSSNIGSSTTSIGGIHSAVYGATWGYTDAWIYLTSSYDGQVVLHHVPSHEKYKILL
jgi:WD40 repeat protein